MRAISPVRVRTGASRRAAIRFAPPMCRRCDPVHSLDHGRADRREQPQAPSRGRGGSHGRTAMTTSKNGAAAAVMAAAVALLVATPSFAAPTPTDQERSSNTYQTYRGATGCVQDLGYGRIVASCD